MLFKKVRGGGEVQIYKINPFKQNLGKARNFAQKDKGGGGQFIKEIPLNEISEKPEILVKKEKGGQLYKRNPFKRNLWKSQIFAH